MGYLWGQDQVSGCRNREVLLFVFYFCQGFCGFQFRQIRYLYFFILCVRSWLVVWVIVVFMVMLFSSTLVILVLYTVWMSTVFRFWSICSSFVRCIGWLDLWIQCFCMGLRWGGYTLVFVQFVFSLFLVLGVQVCLFQRIGFGVGLEYRVGWVCGFGRVGDIRRLRGLRSDVVLVLACYALVYSVFCSVGSYRRSLFGRDRVYEGRVGVMFIVFSRLSFFILRI